MDEKRRFTVLDLLDLELREHNALDLRCLGGRKGLVREITVPDINRPGLTLSGFYEAFGAERIQIFGQGECAYLEKLAAEGRSDTLERFFEFPIPCCVFANSLQPDRIFMRLAEAADCPVLQTELSSSEFSSRLLRVLSDVFAPQTTIHGVLVDVFGIGILLTGDSGVGKSETALELIERGHRLVADDVVEIRCVNGNVLMGQGANKVIGHHMEIRGLGIINVTHLFGVGAIRYYRERDGLHLHVDHLWHPVSLLSDRAFELPVYLGLGVRVFDFDDDREDHGLAVGARAPLGIAFDFNNVPLDLFVELALVVDLFVDYGDRYGADVNGAVGLRYYFN